MSLEEYRKSVGLTQAELAARLGLRSKGSIWMIESGHRPASIRVALQIQTWSNGVVPAAELVSAEDRLLLAQAALATP